MDLLKPSGRAERAIDTLGHYHKPNEATGGSTRDGVHGNHVEICGNISPSLRSCDSQMQDPAHAGALTDLGRHGMEF